MSTDIPGPTLFGPQKRVVTDFIEPGTTLFGEYEIRGELGRGAMGSVYRARHRSLGEYRAIKVMRPEVVADPHGNELFLREARALLEVNHDAVTRCHDLLRDEAGRFYLITEFVEGTSLRDLLRERTLDLDEVAALCERLAHGLAAIHACGVVHRDIAPDNILLPEDRVEEAKIIDFGIAHMSASGTTALHFKGKLAYASPEQLGLFGGEIDARSDLYSLGLVLVEAITGEMQCRERTILQAIERRRQPIAIPRGIPRSLRKQLQGLLAINPRQRFAAAELLLPGAKKSAAPAGFGARRVATAAMSALMGAAAILGITAAIRSGSVTLPAWLEGSGGADSRVVRTDAGDSGRTGRIDADSDSLEVTDTPPAGDDRWPASRSTATPQNGDPIVSTFQDPIVTPRGDGDGEEPSSDALDPVNGPDAVTSGIAPSVDETGDSDDVRGGASSDVCTPESARTRASVLYAEGRACEAITAIDACCPASDRYCSDMKRVMRDRCRAR